MFTAVGMLSLLVASAGSGGGVPAASGYRPHVQVWTDRG